MGKLPIKSGLARNPLTNAEFQSVNDWTKKEWDRLSRESKFPVCLKLANGDYRVATFRVQWNNIWWSVFNTYNEQIAEFTTEAGAVVFCILQHKGKYYEAQQLADLDAKVVRLRQDKVLFRRMLTTAHDKNDGWGIDLYTSRFKDNAAQLSTAQVELNKIIKTTKYYKII